MRNFKSIAIVSASILAGCGQQTSKSSEQPPQTQQAPQASIPSEMGQAAIIAVPVDSKGQENIEQAEMHVLSQAPSSMTTANIAQVYAGGNNANQFVDELDSTSSTESYRGWHNYRFVIRGRVRCGYGPRGVSYGYTGYANYQPTYYYNGNPYAMQYQNSYQTSSMNYYYYNQSQTVNQAPGQYPQYQIPSQQPQQQIPQQYPQQQYPQQQYPQQQYPNQPQQQMPQYPNPQLPNQPQQPQQTW